MNTEQVIELARTHHAGQLDKLGRDYFDAHLAPIAAGAALFGPDAEQAAWLHDIIEDTGITAGSLREFGIDERIISAVESVTRRTGEEYDAFIRRASMHPIGRLVKIADVTWNIVSNPALAESDPELAKRLLNERYSPARDRLLAAMGINACWLGYVELQAVLEDELAAITATQS